MTPVPCVRCGQPVDPPTTPVARGPLCAACADELHRITLGTGPALRGKALAMKPKESAA